MEEEGERWCLTTLGATLVDAHMRAVCAKPELRIDGTPSEAHTAVSSLPLQSNGGLETRGLAGSTSGLHAETGLEKIVVRCGNEGRTAGGLETGRPAGSTSSLFAGLGNERRPSSEAHAAVSSLPLRSNGGLDLRGLAVPQVDCEKSKLNGTARTQA